MSKIMNTVYTGCFYMKQIKMSVCRHFPQNMLVVSDWGFFSVKKSTKNDVVFPTVVILNPV